jgi:hypothetical protein
MTAAQTQPLQSWEQRQLDLVSGWLERDLTKDETASALKMIRRGERAPYVARCVDMWARADRKKESASK